MRLKLFALAAMLCALLIPKHAAAQTDEIQVYDGEFVVNHTMKFMEIEAGIGIGVTSATDKITMKLLLIKDLN